MSFPQQIARVIEKNQKIAIFHHNNIDGDSFSSSYGLLLAIKKKYPNKEVVWVADEEEIAKNFPWIKYESKYVVSTIDDSYLAIIGDTAAINKVSFYDELVKANYIICFDHHQNSIDIKHDLYWQESTYPASTLQAMEIIDALNVEYDEEIAYALILGIITDTGNFTYSLANPKPVDYYAKLLNYISDATMDKFWNQMRRKTIREIEVQKFMYNNLKFEKKINYVYFKHEDSLAFKDINFKMMIHSIGNINDHHIWALFVEIEKEGVMYLSVHLRSNGPDVSQVAMKYGGGGHKRAAGAKIKLEKWTLAELLNDLNNIG